MGNVAGDQSCDSEVVMRRFSRRCAPCNMAWIFSVFALSAGGVCAQAAGQPAPNVPAQGEPRAQEQLPEAPPEKMLKTPPPIETSPPQDEGATNGTPATPPPDAPAEPGNAEQPRVPNT
jgi:hypothetical protein